MYKSGDTLLLKTVIIPLRSLSNHGEISPKKELGELKGRGPSVFVSRHRLYSQSRIRKEQE